VLKSSEFDAYHKWLGIPPQHQPPDHYRLLGLEIFESDLDVIRAAAERQASHIQNYKIGPQSDLSQSLLNEISRARRCLLDQKSKSEYDGSLRTATTPKVPANIPKVIDQVIPRQVVEKVSPPPVTAPTPAPAWHIATPVVRHAVRRKKPGLNWGAALLICLVGVFLTVAVIAVLSRPSQPSTKPGDPPPPVDPVPPPDPNPVPNTQPDPGDPDPVPPKPIKRKWPEPTEEQIKAATALIRIDPAVPPQEILKEARDQKYPPAMRYVLYKMTIEAAIASRNREIALSAVTELVRLFEVDESALRKSLEDRLPVPEVTTPPPTESEVPPVSLFPGVILESGRELAMADLMRVSKDEIMRLFPEGNDTALFVFRSDENGLPEGLLTFPFKEANNTKDKKGGKAVARAAAVKELAGKAKEPTGPLKELTGPTVILYPNGQPKVLLTYVKNSRHGKLQFWDKDGSLLLLSEYRNGNEFGLTCFCKGGQPILIEESGTGGKSQSYLIEITSGKATASTEGALSDEQRVRLDLATSELDAVKKQLFIDEGEWKQSFGKWWDKSAEEIKRLQIAADKADPKTKAEWVNKLNERMNKFRTEGRTESPRLFNRLSYKSIESKVSTRTAALRPSNGSALSKTTTPPNTSPFVKKRAGSAL